MLGPVWTTFTTFLKIPCNFLLLCVSGHPVPFALFLSPSIFASWAYFALYQLKFHLPFKVYFKSHLFHEVFPSSYLLNPRYLIFTLSNVPNIICIVIRSTPQDWILFPVNRVTNHPGLPKMKCDLLAVKLDWEVPKNLGLSVLKLKNEWFLRMQNFQC